MNDNSDNYRLVTEYGLSTYPCGIVAGQKLRIKQEIVVRNPEGKPTGKVYPVGEIWTILSGVKNEPEVIWLRQADGERHTWDANDLLETFELVNENNGPTRRGR